MKKNLTYSFLDSLSRLFNSLIKDKRKALLVSLAVILALLFLKSYKSIFFTILLIGIGAISMLYIRFFTFSHLIGFELCTMSTVVAALAFGPAYGFITGLFSITLGFIISGYFKPSYFISILTLPLMGLAVPFFSNLEIWQIGVLVTVLYDLIILPLYVMMGSRLHSTVIFFFTHLLLNLWVFNSIAPAIYSFIV
jgi:hypothetical protein